MVSLAAAPGCGEGDPDTPTATAPSLERKAEQRLAHLKDRVKRLRQREASKPQDSNLLRGLGALGERIDAELGVAVGRPAPGGIVSGGDQSASAAWSTIKVPIALRVLEDGGGPSALPSPTLDQIRRALTLSDNEAAAALFAQLEAKHGSTQGAADAVTQVLRAAGDDETEVSVQGRDGFSPYGQTPWSANDQARFMAGLVAGCVADPASTGYVLGLMGEVTSDTWGLGSVGVPAKWKGGWGPDPDGNYLVRQMGVLDVDHSDVVVALSVRPGDGTFESGQTAASAVAQWLERRVELLPDASPAC